MHFGDCTYTEIQTHARSGGLALVPTGCTEQQGPHLPVDFDTWFAETLCLAAAERAAEAHSVCALVLPALPFGPTPEHRGFGAGYIHLPHRLHQAVVAAVLDSLAEQGFRRIVIWRGCGQHQLDDVVARFNEDHPGQARAFQPPMPYHEIWCRIGDPGVPGGHADSFATAIALHRRSEAVRVEQIVNPHNAPVDWEDRDLDFSRYSSSGVIGDPTYANAALGAELWATAVDALAQTLQAIAATPLNRQPKDT